LKEEIYNANIGVKINNYSDIRSLLILVRELLLDPLPYQIARCQLVQL